MPRTDAELLIASREDPRAFRKLYDRWADRLLAYFYRRVLDAEVAGDLLAETFAVAFARRRRFRDVGAPGASWLYGIADKELAHWYRRQEVERRAIRKLASRTAPTASRRRSSATACRGCSTARAGRAGASRCGWVSTAAPAAGRRGVGRLLLRAGAARARGQAIQRADALVHPLRAARRRRGRGHRPRRPAEAGGLRHHRERRPADDGAGIVVEIDP